MAEGGEEEEEGEEEGDEAAEVVRLLLKCPIQITTLM